MKLIRSSTTSLKSGAHAQKKNIQRQNSKSFAQVLKNQREKAEVKLSAHAQKRLKQNNINISPQDITKISNAAAKAEKKGSRESLMLLRDLALVVNISNRTVITAVEKTRQKDKIFTNIDSTIIL
ncbi:flagellar protein [Candidatus Poribacteria bacterium]|nr:flagellar protein [Candidatus Poribacteria bacterium]